jgi:transcription factor C subunit 6
LVTLTNGFTQDPRIVDRITKSWGWNVGPGPLWELIEDRGWYKEAEAVGDDVHLEAKRRPKVYEEICVRDDWQLIDGM